MFESGRYCTVQVRCVQSPWCETRPLSCGRNHRRAATHDARRFGGSDDVRLHTTRRRFRNLGGTRYRRSDRTDRERLRTTFLGASQECPHAARVACFPAPSNPSGCSSTGSVGDKRIERRHGQAASIQRRRSAGMRRYSESSWFSLLWPLRSQPSCPGQSFGDHARRGRHGSSAKNPSRTGNHQGQPWPADTPLSEVDSRRAQPNGARRRSRRAENHCRKYGGAVAPRSRKHVRHQMRRPARRDDARPFLRLPASSGRRRILVRGILVGSTPRVELEPGRALSEAAAPDNVTVSASVNRPGAGMLRSDARKCPATS